MSKCVVGIDPGLSGAICVMYPDIVYVNDMPTTQTFMNGKERRILDAQRLSSRFEMHIDALVHVYVESILTVAGQSVQSTTTTGLNYGIMLGVIMQLQLPFSFVHPKTWKKTYDLGSDKKDSIFKANQLIECGRHYWTDNKHDGRAESALIALYGANSLNWKLSL